MEAQSTTQYLNVPYQEKEEAKEMGARWDPAAKKWFIFSDNPKLSNFKKWLPKTVAPPNPTSDIIILNVPFEEKDDAKAEGAKWDSTINKWYVPANHRHPEAFNKWMLSTQTFSSSANSFTTPQKKKRTIDYVYDGNGGALDCAMEYGRNNVTINQMRKWNCPIGYCVEFWIHGYCILSGGRQGCR